MSLSLAHVPLPIRPCKWASTLIFADASEPPSTKLTFVVHWEEESEDDESTLSSEFLPEDVPISVAGLSMTDARLFIKLQSSVSKLQSVAIPNGIRCLFDECFYQCENLSRVTFSSSSSLERIGKLAFSCTGLLEISLPDSVRELGSGCFSNCYKLSRVAFGASSLLEHIGPRWIDNTKVNEI